MKINFPSAGRYLGGGRIDDSEIEFTVKPDEDGQITMKVGDLQVFLMAAEDIVVLASVIEKYLNKSKPFRV